MKTKQCFATAAGLLLCALASAQNPVLNPEMEKLFEKHSFTKGEASLPYRLLKPDGYAEEGTNHYPLVIFLHGIGERGTDTKDSFGTALRSS